MRVFISLSQHAKARFIERGGLDELITQIAMQAFKNGARLTDKEFAAKFDAMVVGQIYGGGNRRFFTREFRKYGKFIYVFGGKSETKDTITYRLITVLPT